ncbi:MAG: head GIN domain-containing protein [Hyphomicrobiales bacterium]
MKNFNYTNIRSISITILSVVFLLSISTLSFGQDTDKRTYDVKPYSAVKVGGAFKVYYTPSSSYDVVIVADADQISKIKAYVLGNTLHIKTKNVINIRTIEAHISAPFLDEIDLSGACRFIIEEGETLKTKSLELDVSGATSVSGDIDVDYLQTDASGASKIVLSGFADRHQCELSGASILRAKELITRDVDVKASGASVANVTYKETITVDKSGAASVRSKKVR